jgi:hypothetical protein
VIGAFPWDPFPPGEPDPKGPDPVPSIAYRAAVTAADAYHAVRLALRREGGALRVGNRFVPDGRYREVAFLAVGNAANSMALAALHTLGDRLTRGFLAGPEPVLPELPFRGVRLPPGLPGAPEADDVVAAANEIAGELSAQDLFLLLLSPGALRALASPPPGMGPEAFAALLADAQARGASGREIGLVARVIGAGGVGGRLAFAAPSADVATFVVERGDGATVLGGGPTRPIEPVERTEARTALARVGLSGAVPDRVFDAPSRDLRPLPGGLVARPVSIAGPGEALRAAADAIFEKGWTARLGFLEMREPPEESAGRFVERAEALAAAEGLTAASRTKGVAVFAAATLGLPEGVDEGPALVAFLARARSLARRRETSVALVRTAGDIGDPAYPPGAVVGTPTDPDATVTPGHARGLRMGRGITDVGCLAIAAYPRPAAEHV